MSRRTRRSPTAYKVYATERKVRFTEMEYAIPREHAPTAIQRVIDVVHRGNLPIMFPLEVRFASPGRRLSVDRARARHLLHRRSPIHRDGVRNILPRRQGDHG